MTIPGSITSSGGNVFIGCTSITSAIVSNMIGWKLLPYQNITRVTFLDGMTEIGEEAFRGCSKLTSITLPDTVTSIGKHAFWGCSGLTELHLPANVTAIEEGAFRGCSSLTEVELPSGITSISKTMFQSCSSLENITFLGDVTFIGENAFGGCAFSSFTIPDTVTTIDKYAFNYCEKLTGIVIPDSVVTLGDYAFKECVNIESLTLGNSVESIGYRCFYDSSLLNSITIPSSVTFIGCNAFKFFFEGTSGITPVVTFVDPSGWWVSEPGKTDPVAELEYSNLNNSDSEKPAAWWLLNEYRANDWHKSSGS